MEETNPILEKCKLYHWLKERNSGFLPGIIKVAAVAEKQLAHQVPRLFPYYTKHDIEHSTRVLDYMAALINDVEALCELEVALLVHSAILHDIGMAIGDKGVEELKHDTLAGCTIKFSAMLKLRDGNEALAVQDIVRRMHADISANKILNEFASYMVLPQIETISIAEDVAAICRCHTRDPSWILSNIDSQNMKGPYTYNPRYICHILRLADLLDFDSRRTPLCLYHLLAPKGLSDDEWQKNFMISNTDKIKEDKISGQKRVVLYGQCENARLHRKLLSYIGWIDAELGAATRASEDMLPQYRLLLRDRVDHRIRTIGYSIADIKLTVDFKSLSTLLMGEHIYGDRRLGLRELVQNGIDSCRVRTEIEAARRKYGDLVYEPRIQIIIEQARDEVIIRDNGCGMTESTIRNYFLNIGRSYYASEDFLLQDLKYLPIGTFGIGFLACFMLSDAVIVRTRHFASGTRCDISFEKGSEFISFTRNEDNEFNGTEVILSCHQFMTSFENKVDQVVEFLNHHMLAEGIIIEIVNRDSGTSHNISQELGFDKLPEKSQIDLDLHTHLNGVRGWARIRRTGHCIRNVQDLDIDHEQVVLWDGTGVQVISDYRLADLLQEDQLQYLTLDVFASRDRGDFLTMKERFGDDIDEIIDKFDIESTITVLVPPELQWRVDSNVTDCDEEDVVIGDLTVGDVMDKVGVSGFIPRITTTSISFLLHTGADLFLPYHVPRGNMTGYSWNWAPKVTIFVRGVRIGNATLPRLALPLFCDLKEITINITHPSIIPDISRNSFDKITQNRLSHVLHRSILTEWQDTISEQEEEKQLIRLFIEKFYSAEDVLIRK